MVKEKGSAVIGKILGKEGKLLPVALSGDAKGRVALIIFWENAFA